jgi:hypothetical protein
MFEDMTLEELLAEIIAKRGPYKQDLKAFAEGVIQHSSEVALEIKRRLRNKGVNLCERTERKP